MAYIDIKQLTELDAELKAELSAEASRISWTSAGRSHVGKVRKVNEDAYFKSSEQHLWAVADGMGGYSRGDYASKVVVEALVHFTRQQNLPASIVDLEVRLRNAHGICRNTFPGERVGATVAALFVYDDCCFFLWAGDSRIYRLRNGTFEQMTKDHTVAQEKCDKGEMSAARAATHSSGHVLTRAVGVHQTLHLDLLYGRAQAGDRYLICSDGLYDGLDIAEIESLLAGGAAEDALERLFDRALDRDGQDNITAIIVEAQD